jgi:hypothetical protein
LTFISLDASFKSDEAGGHTEGINRAPIRLVKDVTWQHGPFGNGLKNFDSKMPSAEWKRHTRVDV